MKLATALIFLTTTLQFAFAGTDQKTVNGWVLDSACALTKGLDKPISRDCALACARNGSPLVILEDDGTIVWPVSDTMPAKSQNDKLVPYAGKRVTVSGKMYEKGGSHAIVMQEVGAERSKAFHLTAETVSQGDFQLFSIESERPGFALVLQRAIAPDNV